MKETSCGDHLTSVYEEGLHHKEHYVIFAVKYYSSTFSRVERSDPRCQDVCEKKTVGCFERVLCERNPSYYEREKPLSIDVLMIRGIQVD